MNPLHWWTKRREARTYVDTLRRQAPVGSTGHALAAEPFAGSFEQAVREAVAVGNDNGLRGGQLVEYRDLLSADWLIGAVDWERHGQVMLTARALDGQAIKVFRHKSHVRAVDEAAVFEAITALPEYEPGRGR